ncbi:MAG: hypothetical protein U1G08_02885 [Verrucomicrobiota bacterium]
MGAARLTGNWCRPEERSPLHAARRKKNGHLSAASAFPDRSHPTIAVPHGRFPGTRPVLVVKGFPHPHTDTRTQNAGVE